jgi:hypothetical protein
MYSSGSFERDFQEYVLWAVSKFGTWRLQMTISDLTKEMQKLDPKHNVNLYRKQYGNTEGALKQTKNPTYKLDAMVVKLKSFDEIKAVYDIGGIGSDCWEFYEKAYKESIEKQKEIMQVNGQNKCKVSYNRYRAQFFRTVERFIK